jgi:hypothetical protein
MANLVKLFHRTGSLNAKKIITFGFQDGEGTYLTEQCWHGVWLSDSILSEDEGAGGDAVIEVILALDPETLENYEWIEEGKPYREWLIPAEIVNRQGTVRLMPQFEWDA